MADAMSAVIGEPVIMKDNKLLFPPAFAKGIYEYYELEDGLFICLIDCQFLQGIEFIRKEIKSNDYFSLHVNLSVSKIYVVKNSGRVLDIGSDWKDAVLFSSTGTSLSLTVPPGEILKVVQIIVSRNWIRQRYHTSDLPVDAEIVRAVAQDLPIQFTVDLDLEMLNLSEEMMAPETLHYANNLFLEGNIKRIISLFTRNMVEGKSSRQLKDENDNSLRLGDAIKVMNMKEQIEVDLSQEIAPISELAKECMMSKTKFSEIFRLIYNKSFYDLVLEMKMEEATKLLTSGLSVTEVATSIGYSNLGHFAKAFKSFFNITPKAYQLAKRDKKKARQ